jgi:hypothetical protein
VLSRNAIRNLQTAAVVAGSIAAWIFVPGETLLPIAWAALAVAIAVCLGIRAYMGKRRSESRLPGEDEYFYTEVAMAFAIVGLAAFIILVIEYS